MNKLKLAFVTIFVVLTTTVFSQHGYEIKVKIPALKDSTVILAHYFGREGSFYPDDTVKLDKKGWGVFKKPTPLTGGMYLIYFPTRQFFDFIVGDQQKFSVEVDTSDLVKGIKFQGSVENNLFYGYKNLISTRNEIVSNQGSSAAKEKETQADALKKINKDITDYNMNVIRNYPKLYFSTWLNALRDVDVPDFPRDAKGVVTDSAFRYNYWHKHYFDNFDLSDARLLRTPFYDGKVKYYLDKVIPQYHDSINSELDGIITKVKGNQEVFRYTLGLLYNHYATLANQIVGMDAVFVYFAEKYYLPNSTWDNSKFKEDLQKTIDKVKPNLIGKEAPDIDLVEVPTNHFLSSRTDTSVKNSMHLGNIIKIKDINAKYLVLAFWEVGCGHCKKDIPLLYDSIYPNLKDKGLKILAIQMLSNVQEKTKWVDFVNEHKLYDFINAVPYSDKYRDLYNVYSTPTIYLLDENKKIIAKNIGIRQIEEILKFEDNKKLSAVNKLH